MPAPDAGGGTSVPDGGVADAAVPAAAGLGEPERLRRTRKTTTASATSAAIATTMIQVFESDPPPGVHTAFMTASPSITNSASAVMVQVAVAPLVELALLSPSDPGAETLNTIENS